MPSKTTTALAILLVFGSGSAALADTNNRTGHHGSVARRAVPVTMPNGRNRTVDHAVKPFTAEEKGRPREQGLLSTSWRRRVPILRLVSRPADQ